MGVERWRTLIGAGFSFFPDSISTTLLPFPVVLIVTMLNFPLIILSVLLSGVVAVRDCNKDEECVLASNCIQYTEDSEDLGFYAVNSPEYNDILMGLDEQICATNRRTGEEKVCCRREDLDDQKTSGGTRLTNTSSLGGTSKIETRTKFGSCPSTLCKRESRAGREFCCLPYIKKSTGKMTCKGARRCYAL